MAVAIAAGSEKLIERGTVACRRTGEPLGMLALITQAATRTKAAAKWSEHCRVTITNHNGSFASWTLALTATGPRRFAPGKAVIAFGCRGKPLRRFFVRRGHLKLIAHRAAPRAKRHFPGGRHVADAGEPCR